jgi:hypothetical protein
MAAQVEDRPRNHPEADQDQETAAERVHARRQSKNRATGRPCAFGADR